MNFSQTLKDVVGFVKRRVKKTGGFGATPQLPATMEDTYHALRIIDLVQRWMGKKSVRMPGSIDAHREYLCSLIHMPANTPKTLFQLLWSCNFTGIFVDNSHFPCLSSAKNGTGMPIDYYYYLVRALVESFDGSSLEILESRLKRTEAFWDGIVRKRWMALYLDSVLRLKKIDGKKAAEWFRECQNGDGGFGFMPHTTSYVDNCNYALRALSLLKRPPRDTRASIHFVLSCKTSSGGFSRKSNAAPFLDATWHAAMSLSVLNSFLCGDL